MSIGPGSSLSHYEILAPLGAGAMGEVWRARDTKLGREVAIKVLPEHFVDDEERLRRFEREAKTLATLNHPNVAQIFGVDQVGDTCFLVLELVPGESLEERLKRGPLPLDEALDVCTQIADGLAAAHEAGVIHRDLKPANVRVTPDGKVKVLDFGLAKPAGEGRAGSSTDSVLSTEAGRLLGTPTYMAPEQARGKPIDKRVDVWAFGCVLFECLTAQRAFAGETLTDVFAAVIEREPDLSKLPAATPPRVRELLARCLAKERRNRLHDMADARLELESAAADPRAGTAQSAAQRPLWRAPAVLVSAGLLVAAIGFAAFALRGSPSGSRSGSLLGSLLGSRTTPASSNSVVRATLTLPPGLALPATDRSIALSPDGKQLVAALGATDGSAPQALYLRDLARLEFRRLPGTEEATYPFWSPDGRSIAFFAGRELRRIDLADGIVRVICKAPAGRGGAWGTRGSIVFAPSATGGLFIVSDSGGTPSLITEPATGPESKRVPRMLPDGERFLYYAMNAAQPGVYAFDPASKRSHLVVEGLTEAVYVEPSALVFARDGNLVVQPFDLERLQLTGNPQPIAAGVHWDSPRAALNMDISAEGALVYQPVVRPGTRRLAWMDAEGARSPLPIEPLALRAGVLSPDGRRLAANVAGLRNESLLSILDLERGVQTPLGDPGARFYFGAIWTLDGQRVVTTDGNGSAQTLVSFPFGGGAPTLLLGSDPQVEYAPGPLTPDGLALLVVRVALRDKVGDIMRLDLRAGGARESGGGALEPWMTTPEAEWNPVLSPAGDALVYLVSEEDSLSGALKLVAFPTPATPVQVSSMRVGLTYGWLSGTEIYWSDTARQMWSAAVAVQGGQIEVGAPKAMFGGRAIEEETAVLAYDAARKRFLVATEASAQEEARLVVVSDWRVEVGAGLPGRK